MRISDWSSDVCSSDLPEFICLTRLERETTGELARNISIDQIRSLQRLFSNAPSLSNCRVVIIDAADDLERGAANALLKNLEEPPAGTLFLLVSHADRKSTRLNSSQ